MSAWPSVDEAVFWLSLVILAAAVTTFTRKEFGARVALRLAEPLRVPVVELLG